MVKRLTKYWYFGYLLLLLGIVFYVNSILKQDDIKIDQEKPDKAGVEQKIVKVDITVNNGTFVKNYQTKLRNIDSVYDVFDEIREENDFFYQISGYLYGTEIDCINETCAKEGYKWIAYKDKVDITSVLKDTSLDDNTVIELKLEKR